ncbi:MAG TPA: threonine--tRNA ligase [Alphaproteobacteria bacterium]|jgi:threonyl-tRNA synthetase|nr:threonine--tRNA ligase [Alphaproteobacteria bacterium]MDP7164027.1 threonine--tRNA ligase [Alphaproteobacteria bacterium]MDP7428930.1 threonine--tRNA ligase [Alphaproteobacteria bacterium]HJM51232.1 threonine--tRNA ligase [Alphaproteobacteria bacterium]
MVAITLPDGSVRDYDEAPSGGQIAADIGPGLAKAALAVRVDGTLWDLGRPIEADAAIAIVTAKDDDETVLGLLRHSAAHALAQAAKELYAEVQVTIGPNVEDGFYYDFSRPEPFTPEDLEKLEARMHEIVGRDQEIGREVWQRDEAINWFREQGESYKAEIIADLPEHETITVYRQGGFVDLCRGPHLPSTGKLGRAFKLMKLAGAYWRGDSRNEMLQRVYGTAWRTEKELKAYLTRLEEAEKRDHRKLGRELNLFHFQEEAAGMAFWHPKGWTLWRAVESYMRNRLQGAGYVEVKTPQLVDRSLWEASGHWEKFREHMYTSEFEDRVYALKPMNCPCHVQIFRQGLKSYRDLPLRMAEFGSCHRYEPSGALHGLMRVRNFVQDDAHIFCTEDQIVSETEQFCALVLSIYRDFGFEDVGVKLADRPPVRAGSDAIWDKAEKALGDAVAAVGQDYQLNPGDGAFYGPKLDFYLTDSIGREWQCGTLQVDFVLPERLGAEYVGVDSARHRPVMLHRAILGSLERFIGILIEEHEGKFPLWLAPVQVVVTTITSEGDDYARTVAARLEQAGLRVELDLSNEKINYKVRQHSLAKVPAIIAIGKREAAEGSVALRRLGDKGQQSLELEEALAKLKSEARMPGA